MPTSQDAPQGRRPAHFSKQPSEGESSGSTGRVRRTATRRSDNTGTVSAPRPASGTTKMSERTARATKRAAAARKRRSQDAGARRIKKSGGHNSTVVAIMALTAVLFVVCVGLFVVPNLFKRTETKPNDDYPAGEVVIVTIPDGSTGSQIAELLIENHVISSDQGFYQETQKQNADAKMKSGTYQFVTGATVSEVVRQLVEGPNAKEYQLKLAEGLTVEQTAKQVESQVGISAKEFLKQAKASNYVDDYPFLKDAAKNSEYDSLEGYLFGKTYDLGGTDMTADSVIRTLLDQYQAEVGSLDFASARSTLKDRFKIDISDYGIIKLASVIEREAVTDEDRPLIGSVFYNRLSNGMYLQSDATMMYVTGGEVTATDLEVDSPFNTYKHSGLTPTPICSPSLASIMGALDPDNTEYFYFFINENVHQFSRTYEEHQQAINESLNS